MELKKERDVAVDFVKIIATLLVINSHMGICYGSYSRLATGGGIGDALFFFISGFTLFMGRKACFMDWYKKRLRRIYPTILAVGLLSCIIFDQNYSFLEVIIAKRYWFLQCILVCYVFIFPIIYYGWKLSICISISIIITLISFFTLFNFDGQMFYGVNNHFRWIFYFSIMLIGGYTYTLQNRFNFKKWNILVLLLCIVLWYGIILIANGKDLIIISFVPLVGICISLYLIGKSSWIKRLFSTKIFGRILFIIGNLCLESYMVQKYIFTDTINNIFPFNIPIMIVTVLLASYLLHIISEIICNIFDSKPINWKSTFLL